MAYNNDPRQKGLKRFFGDAAGEGRFRDDEVSELELQLIETYSVNKGHPVRTLLRMYKGHIKELLLGLLFYILKTVPVLVMPIITARIINLAADPPEDLWTQLTADIIIMVALLVLNIPNTITQYRFDSVISRKVEAAMRGAMVRKLQQLTIPFHKRMQSGRIQAKIISDVNTIYELSSHLFTTLPSIAINMIMALSVVITSNMTIFLFFLLTIPCSVITVRAFRKPIMVQNRAFRKGMEHTSSNVADMVEMTEITRAHALENREIDKMTSILNRLATTGFKLDMVTSLFGSVSWVVFQLFQFLCLIFSAYMAYTDRIGIGDIALYQSYFTMLTGQVSTIIGLLPTISKGFESITSMGEILTSDEVEQNEGKPELPELRGEFEFRDVCFAYEDGLPLLKNMNLKVRAGETVAFVGESGAGKTTMLNLLLGFNVPESGAVLVDGQDLTKIDLRSYRRHLATVPQNSVLFTGTIRENITYGLKDCSEERLQQALDAACLTDFINSLPDGVDTKLEEHGANLSGGQRQRLSIARAIIRDPDVIILDEATSALDSVSERMIQDAINNLAKGRTTFIVAHRLSTIKSADRIAVIKDGVCAEIGTFDELMEKQGEFFKLRSYQQI